MHQNVEKGSYHGQDFPVMVRKELVYTGFVPGDLLTSGNVARAPWVPM